MAQPMMFGKPVKPFG